MSAQTCPAPAAWIDATDPACGRRLWGMNLVERQVRQLCLRGVSRFRIQVSASSSARVRAFRPDLHRLYAFQFEFDAPVGSAGDQAAAAAPVRPAGAPDPGAAAGPGLLVVQGAAVYDDRVFEHLLAQDRSVAVCGVDGAAAARLWPAQLLAVVHGGRLTVEAAALRSAGVPCLAPGALDPYVAALRLRMPAIMARVPATGSLRELDHLMYRRTFKGAIDAVALYAYYHLVRWITRHLSVTSLPPNLFTVLSILSIWAAVPLFAFGWFRTAVAVAWVGVILDSVDGKLARLRLHLSSAMGAVEHITAMPALGLWYVTVGYRLTGGQLWSPQPLALVSWCLVGTFLLDKCVTGVFKAACGRELFDYAPVDTVFHLVAARRNTALVLLTLGAAAGRMGPALVAVALWTGVALIFHAVRALWIAGGRRLTPQRPS
jgi:phosphatidylglycerophosphate synthase